MIKKTLGTVFSLLLSFGLLLLANGLFSTLLGVRTQVEGYSPNLVGFIVAAYFAGLLCGGLFAGRVVIRVGHIRAFAAFASLMSVSALMHPIWIEPAAWMILRMLAGFCMAGMIMVTESWLNESATNQNRGQVLSFYMITNYFAAGCGQFLLNVGDPSQFQLFTLASVLFSVALLPVLLTRAKAPVPKPSTRMKLTSLYKIAPLGVIGVFCSGLVNSSIYGLAPVYAIKMNITGTQLSLFMATLIMSGLLLQWNVGRLSDRIGRGPLLIYIPIMVALTAIWIIFRQDFYSIIIATAVFGALVFTIYSLATATANDQVDSDKRVQLAGALLIAYGAGACTGPIIAGQFMQWLGPTGLFAYFAGICIFLSVFAIFKRRRGGSPDTRKPFVVVAGTQATSNELFISVHEESPDKVELASVDQTDDEQGDSHQDVNAEKTNKETATTSKAKPKKTKPKKPKAIKTKLKKPKL